MSLPLSLSRTHTRARANTHTLTHTPSDSKRVSTLRKMRLPARWLLPSCAHMSQDTHTHAHAHAHAHCSLHAITLKRSCLSVCLFLSRTHTHSVTHQHCSLHVTSFTNTRARAHTHTHAYEKAQTPVRGATCAASELTNTSTVASPSADMTCFNNDLNVHVRV